MGRPVSTEDAVGRTVQLCDGRVGVVQSAYSLGGGMDLDIRITGYDTPHPSLPKPAHMTAAQRAQVQQASHAYEVDADGVYFYDTPGAEELSPALTESSKVAVGQTGPTRWGVPSVGDFILVGNAGGRHQCPGSYGYTRTEVLAVEHENHGGYASYRLTTRAYDTGCWTSGEVLICGSAPAR